MDKNILFVVLFFYCIYNLFLQTLRQKRNFRASTNFISPLPKYTSRYLSDLEFLVSKILRFLPGNLRFHQRTRFSRTILTFHHDRLERSPFRKISTVSRSLQLAN